MVDVVFLWAYFATGPFWYICHSTGRFRRLAKGPLNDVGSVTLVGDDVCIVPYKLFYN